MAAHAEIAPELQLTVEEFLAFTATRPDGERWELIEGRAVMHPSPTDYHQIIVANIVTFLMVEKRRLAAAWLPLLGVGTRVPISENSLPQPDVMVKGEACKGSPVSEESLVLFEVLSHSNTKADQAWRRKVYASVPNCQHYVTVSMRAVEVVVYDRATGWKRRAIVDVSGAAALPAIDVSIPLSDIYRWTPLAEPRP
jgi:Uma2 family endonuclease